MSPKFQHIALHMLAVQALHGAFEIFHQQLFTIGDPQRAGQCVFQVFEQFAGAAFMRLLRQIAG